MRNQYEELETQTRSTYGNVKSQVFASLSANSLSLIQGCLISISSILLLQIQETDDGEPSLDGVISISLDEGSWFASLYCAGYVFGSLVGGMQSDYFGRRISLILDCIVVFAGVMMIALGNSFPLLLVGRYLGGHACGSAMVSLPAYNSEISHKSLRGMLSGIQIVLYYVGCFIITILGYSVPWRMAVGLCGALPLVSVLSLLFCPESPVWLLRFGREEEAKKSLITLYGSKHEAEEEMINIQKSLSIQKIKEEPSTGTFLAKLKSILIELKDPTFRQPLFHLIFIVPFVGGWCGVVFISMYLVPFLSNLNVPINPYIAASILSLYRLLMGLISLAGLVKVSRRLMLVSSLSVMCLSTLSISLHQYLFNHGYWHFWGLDVAQQQILLWIPVVSIIILYGAMAIGFAPSARTLQGELLPANKRSLGGSIIGLLEGVTMFIVNKVAPKLMEVFGIHGCFLLFAAVQASGVFFVFFFLPETKGKSLQEINHYYREKGKMNSTDPESE